MNYVKLALLISKGLIIVNSFSNSSAKRTVSDKIFKDRAYEIAISPKYDGYQIGLASMVKVF